MIRFPADDARSGRRAGARASSLSIDERKSVRTALYLVGGTVAKLIKDKQLTTPAELAGVRRLPAQLSSATQFIPSWVKLAVALALGLGTMIGWKRIVVPSARRSARTTSPTRRAPPPS
jgi:phosphate/sulfate permease